MKQNELLRFSAKGRHGSIADRVFGEGKQAVCLYTDLTNPFSNRCYANIGFKPYCDSWHYLRR
jgi:predicted GNAT family acetyltransferase